MSDRGASFWDQLLAADCCKPVEHAALETWVVREGSEVAVNAMGFPYGIPYREVAAKLAERGFLNGKGRPFHPHQVKELIAHAIVKKTFATVDCEKKDREAQKNLYRGIWRALRLKRPYRKQQ